MSRRNLVLAAVGDDSLHARWRRGGTTFDLFLVYYGDGPDRFSGDADYYLRMPGQKWHLVHYALSERPELIDRYDAFWVPDDDLRIAGSDVDALFAVFHEHELQLAQPAVALGRHVSHPICAERPGLLLRRTRFVEIQAPIFSRDALRRLLPSFVASRSGWGLDLAWPGLLDFEGMGIIDAYPVAHTRPVRSAGVAAEEDVTAVARQFALGAPADLFRVLEEVTLADAGQRRLGSRRRLRAAAYRAARPLAAPLLRLVRR